MRLFLDECISPKIALALIDEGEHYVVHPRNNGGLGDPDHRVLQRCIDNDLVIVTENARDFRSLATRVDIHPGMILIPCLSRGQSEALIRHAVARLNRPDDLVNKVMELDEDGTIRIYDLPAE